MFLFPLLWYWKYTSIPEQLVVFSAGVLSTSFQIFKIFNWPTKSVLTDNHWQIIDQMSAVNLMRVALFILIIFKGLKHLQLRIKGGCLK